MPDDEATKPDSQTPEDYDDDDPFTDAIAIEVEKRYMVRSLLNVIQARRHDSGECPRVREELNEMVAKAAQRIGRICDSDISAEWRD